MQRPTIFYERFKKDCKATLTKHSIQLWFKTKILDLQRVQGQDGPKTVSVSLKSQFKIGTFAVTFACVDSFHRLSV